MICACLLFSNHRHLLHYIVGVSVYLLARDFSFLLSSFGFYLSFPLSHLVQRDFVSSSRGCSCTAVRHGKARKMKTRQPTKNAKYAAVRTCVPAPSPDESAVMTLSRVSASEKEQDGGDVGESHSLTAWRMASMLRLVASPSLSARPLQVD